MLDQVTVKQITSRRLSLHPASDTPKNPLILGRITALNYAKAGTSACDAPRPQNKIHPHSEWKHSMCGVVEHIPRPNAASPNDSLALFPSMN